ncbi:MAG: hypothetical protein IJ313_03920 [Clostridia bacterium]|nr:hypothetical protein [Clostridia bacterium]
MHAMIITAYQDFEGLVRVLTALSARALCFVHIDAKSAITAQQTAHLDAMENVRAIRKYEINWGSVYHLHALLDLCRMALEDARVGHLHLISAQDFPCVSADDFERFFEGDERIHMQSLVTADYPELAHRYEHFHFMHLMNYRDMSENTQNWVGRIDRWQEKLHIRRNLPVRRKGLVWLSLPRAAAEHALNAPQNRKLLRKLKYTYIPEEFYFQNAFAGTPFEEKITGRELRFSIWDEPQRGTPALLDEGDLAAIDESGCVFCRKVNAGTVLYEQLERRWLGK